MWYAAATAASTHDVRVQTGVTSELSVNSWPMSKSVNDRNNACLMAQFKIQAKDRRATNQ
jgi:hypothetical protein